MKLCIIGSGPAGLSLASRLLKFYPSCQINFIDSRSTPYGLLKFGVAPDHPEVKGIARNFEPILKANANIRFFGGIRIGKHLELDDIRKMHDAVVISTGMPSSKMLNIPGEDLKNCITASKFVGWYNGDPSYSPSDVDLSNVRRAAVIGNGNVALDVARVLLKPWTSFIGTDMSQSALEALKTAEIQQVDIIGRRGPLQMSFTISELREMFDLPYLRFSSDVDVLLREINRDIDLWRHDRANRRLFQLLLDKLQTGDARTVTAEHTQEKCWSLDFFMRPTLISGTGRVHNVTFQKTDLVKEIPIGRSYRQRAIIDTPDTLKRQYELIVTCCGFEATNNLGLPIDEHGAIKNCNGRVQDLSGVYSCGWAATGAVGDLSSTLINSRMVADAILSDLSNIQPTKSTGGFEDFLRKKGIKFDCYE